MKRILFPFLFSLPLITFSQHLLKDIGSGNGNTYFKNHEEFNSPTLNDTLFLLINNYSGDSLKSLLYVSENQDTLRRFYPNGSSTMGKIIGLYRVGNYLIYNTKSGDSNVLLSTPVNSPSPVILWQTNGVGSNLTDFFVLNNKLIFKERNVSCNCDKLISTTGAYASATVIKLFDNFEYTYNYTQIGNRIFFSGSSLNQGIEPWVTDGTALGTTQIQDILLGTDDSYPHSFTEYGGKAYFAATAAKNGSNTFNALFETDGTTLGTHLIYPQPYTDGGFYPSNLQILNNEIYVSDLTDFGKVNISNGTYTPLISTQMNTVASFILNGAVYAIFSIENPPFKRNYELWKSGGTQATTSKIKTLAENADVFNVKIWHTSSKTFMEITHGYLYNEKNLEVDIWLTDGTSNGTKKVNYIDSTIFTKNNRGGLGTLNNTFYFNAYREGIGYELLKTDGTSVITVEDRNKGFFDSAPSAFFSINDTTYFMASDNKNGRELWQSNGLKTNTLQKFDWTGYDKVTPFGNSAHNLIGDFGVLGSKMIFIDPIESKIKAYDQTNGLTTNLLDFAFLYTSTSGKVNRNFTKLGNQLVFSHSIYPFGNELWVTDGTEEGTKMLKDLNLGTLGSDPSNFIQIGNIITFTTSSPKAFWKTDGTEIGTQILSNINANSYQLQYDDESTPPFFKRTNTAFYSYRNFDTGKDEIYAVDENGVSLIGNNDGFYKTIGWAELSNGVYFRNFNPARSNAIYRINNDNSLEGVEIAMPLKLFAFRDSLFYSQNISGLTYLFKSDGNTFTNTFPIVFGSSYSRFTYVPVEDSFILISALNKKNGIYYHEIWIHYGEYGLERKLFEIKANQNKLESAFSTHHLANKKLYFSMNTESLGNELWIIDLNCPENIVINKVQEQNAAYSSSGTIELSSSINELVKTELNAKNTISLSPGAQIESGAVFKAEIMDCPY